MNSVQCDQRLICRRNDSQLGRSSFEPSRTVAGRELLQNLDTATAQLGVSTEKSISANREEDALVDSVLLQQINDI